jgi:hypothetical protein
MTLYTHHSYRDASQCLYVSCVFKTVILLNDFLHTSHWYACSPVNICWCVLRLPLLLNNLLHKTQENGSFRLCTNLCFQIRPLLNNLKHTSHLNGFLPLCMFWCLYRTPYDIMTSYAHHSEMNTPQHSDVVDLHYVWTHILWINLLLHTHITGKQMFPAIYHFMILLSTLIIEWHITCITFICTVPNMY